MNTLQVNDEETGRQTIRIGIDRIEKGNTLSQ